MVEIHNTVIEKKDRTAYTNYESKIKKKT